MFSTRYNISQSVNFRHQKLLNAQLKEQARKKKKYNKTPAAVLLSSASK